MSPGKAQTEGARRSRGRPSEGVRDAILAAAGELLRDSGAAGATTAAIAERARASEASIHYHFGGKEALLEAAVLGAVERLRDRSRQISASPDEPLSESLLDIATALEPFYDELVPLLVAVHSDPQLRRALAPRLASQDLGPHRAVSLIARHITDHRRAHGLEGRGDIEAAALLLVGACFLRAWQRQINTQRSRRLPSLARAVAVLAEQATPT
jgi:AcrR family transcriptional regulator